MAQHAGADATARRVVEMSAAVGDEQDDPLPEYGRCSNSPIDASIARPTSVSLSRGRRRRPIAATPLRRAG
jgi:hypothetical protein